MTDIREICQLSEEDLEARRVDLGRRLAPELRGRRNLSDGVILSFDATPEMREELSAFVAFESECCPSLKFSVSEVAGELELEMRCIDPSAVFFADVGLSADSDETESGTEGSSRWRPVLDSIGLGALGALAVCCALPMALVAASGTAVAAPFSTLDNPWLISASAFLFAAGIWRWQRRRKDVRPAMESGRGCGC